VRQGKLENRLYRLATRCVQKGLKSRGRLPRYFLLALSALISPWQARYFLIRLRLKRRLRALEECTEASGA
jgi:hypothetical protein